MTKKVLTGAAAMEIKRLYALVDARGGRLHSQMEIADMLGVSETTVFRAVHKRAAYGGVRDLPTEGEAEESERRFREARPELFEEDTALARLQRAVAEHRALPGKVDEMLGELNVRSPLDE